MGLPGRRIPPKIAVLLLLVSLAAASFATRPVISPAAGRPLLAGAQVDPQVLSILQRSCRDCHSESTRYPWYSYVAPVSFLIRSDVARGRRRLNLSRWDQYTVIRRERFLSEIANQVRDRDMPLLQYTLIHRGARLTDAQVDAVFRWTQAERTRLILQNAAR